MASIEVVSGPLDGLLLSVDNECIIGRQEDCDIALTVDRYVSRKHAKIYKQGDKYFLIDLGSTNGTYYKNLKIEKEVELKEGDKFLIGHSMLKFYYNS